jgi:uncharacterized membrane protein YhaH (DUF805 family)
MGNLSLSDIKTEFKQAQLRKEKGSFIIKTIVTVLIYYGLSEWLNTIRATALNWFVWVLAITQILFYFLISYRRFKELGYNKLSWIIVILAFVGRVENWEIIVIPLLVVVMFIFTFMNKNLSLKEQEFYKQ